MKLKELGILPNEIDISCAEQIGLDKETYNQAIRNCGEIEIEADVGKIKDIIYENVDNIVSLAQAIAKALPSIIKRK